MIKSFKRMFFSSVLIFSIFTSALFVPTSMAINEASFNFSTYGTITYSSHSSALPNSVIGEDYLRYYENADPDVAWASDFMAHFVKWNCNTARLAFAFADAPTTGSGRHTDSVYDQAKMDRVLEIFDSYGIKVIFDLHNVGDHTNYLGSWNLGLNQRLLNENLASGSWCSSNQVVRS